MTIALSPVEYPMTSLSLHDRAESPEAPRLTGVWTELVEARNATAWTEQSLADLDAVAAEAQAPNWDSYGARPVSLAAYRQATRMLQSLPSAVPPPEVGITPDGKVLLEWQDGPQWAFSIVLGPDNIVTYAGLFGAGRTHGKEAFVDEVPHPLMAALYRYLGAVGQR
jgi:hypothetical protein